MLLSKNTETSGVTKFKNLTEKPKIMQNICQYWLLAVLRDLFVIAQVQQWNQKVIN